jgi:hypothetical protein
MATPVVPSQFAVGKNRIIHKPTTATFSFDTGHTTFKSFNWGRAERRFDKAIIEQRRLRAIPHQYPIGMCQSGRTPSS